MTRWGYSERMDNSVEEDEKGVREDQARMKAEYIWRVQFAYELLRSSAIVFINYF